MSFLIVLSWLLRVSAYLSLLNKVYSDLHISQDNKLIIAMRVLQTPNIRVSDPGGDAWWVPNY